MGEAMEVEIGSGEESWRGGAGSVLNMSVGSTVSIEYHSGFGSHDDLMLLEVDDKILPDILQNRATIRGQVDEEAVMCTPSTTYALKFVGTSNSVFLIPSGQPSSTNKDSACGDNEINNQGIPVAVASVIKLAPGSMELVQVAPKLDKLKYLLKQRPYRPEEEDEMEMGIECTSGLYRWEDLVNVIQASDEELMSGLKALSAVEVNGFWRIIDEKFMDTVLKMILNNSIIHDWPLEALDEDKVLSVLEEDGFARNIVLHCLSTYGNKEDSIDGGFVWSLDKKKLCVHCAMQVLGGGKMKLETFMEKWMSTLPSGLHADLQYLENEAIYEKLGIETWIRAFSISALPLDPAERFAVLFRERPKWEGKDLQPFIRDLRVPGLSAEALLMKYARRIQPTGDAEPIFSAR